MLSNGIWQYAVVGVSGGVGAMARFGVNELCRAWTPLWAPLATLTVNVLGCLVAGVVMYATLDKQAMSHAARLVVMTGLMGGMTTFSGFGYDCVALAREGRPGLAGLNVGANLVLGLGAVMLGRSLARAAMG